MIANRRAVTVALALLVAAPAAAQPSTKKRSDASAAYQEGQRRYLDEDYAGAAVQFETAYSLDPDPAYEFNIAQAYRLAGSCEKALNWYRKFLVDAPKAPNTETVKKYIADEEAQCEKPATAPVAVRAPPQPDPPAPESSPTSAPSHLRRDLGFGALALGTAGVITGVVFTAKTFDYADRREKLCVGDCDPFPKAAATELDRKGNRAEKLAWIGYGVGAVAVGAGLWLIFSDAKPRESSVAIVPLDGGGIVSWSTALSW